VFQIGPNWDGYTVENVKAGAYHAGIKDHPDAHWLVTEKDHRTGTKSAIWNLIDINDGTTELWGGAYNHAKTKKAGLTLHGMPAKKVSTAHYNEAVKTLQTSLQTYSPFGKGLGVAVQKLDDSAATGDTMVTVELTRTPMHVKNGYVPPERKEILTEEHIMKINGGGRRAGARGAVGSTTTAAGFESEFPIFNFRCAKPGVVLTAASLRFCRVHQGRLHCRRRARAGDHHTRR